MTNLCYAVIMNDILLELGLGDSESTVYVALLKTPNQTAHEIASATGVKRTNVYRILDVLQEQELITADDSPVKRFRTTDPRALQDLVQEKQSALKRTAHSLATAMPTFRSQYALSLDRPGVVHMTGKDGLERLLEDMLNSQTEVLLVAGDEPHDEATRERFRELIMQRKSNGVATRALFHDGEHRARILDKFTARGFDVRFVGDSLFDSEIVIYEDNVVFSSYDPSIIITIITNPSFAATMRQLFNLLWKSAS